MSARQIVTRGIANLIYFVKRNEFRHSRQKFLVFTGTSGKTTTRDAVVFGLQKAGFPALSKPLGYTNEIGVLLTALNITSFRFFSLSSWRELFKKKISDDSFVCVELGADFYQDTFWFIRRFTPFAVFIIGMSDAAWSRDINTIIRERKALFSKTPSEGYIFYNKDDAEILKIIKEADILANQIGVSLDDKDAEIFLRSSGAPLFESVTIVTSEENTPLKLSQPIFLPQAYAVGCAIGLLRALRYLSFGEIFADYTFSKDRLQIYKTRSAVTIVEDSYKATPFCTTWFLKMAASMEADKKIVIITEMRPLSFSIEKYYTRIGIDTRFANKIYFLGPKSYFNFIHKVNLRAARISETDYARIAKEIAIDGIEQTTVFLKGSYRHHLDSLREKILEADASL